jgi:uncharacterized membrane-anchored protein YhcB (DUF1043 family)
MSKKKQVIQEPIKINIWGFIAGVVIGTIILKILGYLWVF